MIYVRVVILTLAFFVVVVGILKTENIHSLNGWILCSTPRCWEDFFEELMSLQTLARYFTSGRVQKLPILDHYSNGSSSYASDFLARLSSDDGLDLSKLKASDLNR